MVRARGQSSVVVSAKLLNRFPAMLVRWRVGGGAADGFVYRRALAQSILAATRKRYPTVIQLVSDNLHPSGKAYQVIFSVPILPDGVSFFCGGPHIGLPSAGTLN
jgi:hypothetical protein